MPVNCLHEIFQETCTKLPLSQFTLRLAIHSAYSRIFHICNFVRIAFFAPAISVAQSEYAFRQKLIQDLQTVIKNSFTINQ